LLVQVRWRAIHHAGGLAGFIKEEHRWDSRDVAEGLRRGCVSNGPVQVGAQRIHGFPYFVFRRFNRERENGHVIAIFLFQIAKPLQR
jgi:hypothetical protein